MRKFRSLLSRLMLSVSMLVLLGLVLELVVFRFILPAASMPRLQWTGDVIKYRPAQSGVYRVRNEIAARYRINADGWNSGVEHYAIERTPGRRRIAVIGDSFVEALHVDYDASLAEQLQSGLGDGTEVYRFGISGAPLSQYLHLVRSEVARYSPDVVVVVLVHNDFSESFRAQPGVYTRSFLKLQVSDGRVIAEVEPARYRPPWYSFIRRSATWRYVTYRQQVQLGALRNVFLRRDETATFEANVDVAALAAQQREVEVATDYLVAELAASCEGIGAQLLLLMNADLDAIYAGREAPVGDQLSGALGLNHLAATVAARHGIAFVDLHPVFAADWAQHHERFDFSVDRHWSRHGHALAAEVVATWLGSR